MLVKSQAKYIQSLGQKKHRDEADVFVAEGPKIVTELLQTASVQQVFAVKNWIEANQHLPAGITVTEVSEDELGKISQLATPNQVLAIVEKFESPVPVAVPGKFILALDTIQDPGNLGTIIRTADWFGVDQVVCSPDSADLYNPKVVQATMASIARVHVSYTDIATWLSQQQARVYGAMLEGQDIRTMQKPAGGILVIGNESKGISEEVRANVNVRVTIPQTGKAESLNAAVATGIILSHFT